jgi:hypothetical protein
MIQLAEIYDEARKIIGICDDTKLFRWIADAVSLIANKGDFEGLRGFLDICTAGCCCEEGSNCNAAGGCGRRCVVLPREVQTVIGVNIAGKPSVGFSQLFSFHINGPGDCKKSCDFSWEDKGGNHSTYRDLIIPAKLVVHLQTDEDNGKEVIVYGFDKAGQLLRHQVGTEWRNGAIIPTIFGVALPASDSPIIARITGVFKERTVGSVRLSTIDDTGASGVTLAVYEPDETVPQYRRIRLNRSCNWVRIAYLRNNPTFFSKYDHIPLLSRVALLLAIQARKHYSDLQIADAHAMEADAARLELEAQNKADPPTYFPPQIIDMNNLRDKSDYSIV